MNEKFNDNLEQENHLAITEFKPQGLMGLKNNHENAMTNAGMKLQIGELRRAYIDLEKSRDHYLGLYDHAPSGYLAITEDGIIVESNYAAANLLGLERKKLNKRRFAGFVTEESKGIWNRHCLLINQSEDNQKCLLSLIRADGATLDVQLNCVRKQILDRPPVFLVIIKKVAGSRQTDEALRIAAAAFETQDGIIVTDANKIILRVNEAFTRITGYSIEDSLNQAFSVLCSGQYDEQYHQSIWLSVMNNGYWQGEIWDKRKNGEIYPIWLKITAVLDKNDCVSHYVCSLTDITAQKQAEKILLDARQRLENQVSNTKEELEKVKKETADINAALTVLIQHQESHKNEYKQALSREVEETILPFLKKLKGANTGRVQSSQLLSILEVNLLQLVGAYGRTGGIPDAFNKLTPLEAQVASMVRQGLPTKVIATTLNISEGTVGVHRNHIRQKLGLKNKSDNLQMYLQTLLD